MPAEPSPPLPSLLDARDAPRVVGVMRGTGDQITEADDAFLAIVGYPREEFEQLRLNWRAMTPPEFLRLDDAAIQQATRGGGFTAPYQKEYIRRDGTRATVLLVCAFIPDAPGQWMGYVVDLAAHVPARASAGTERVSLRQPVPTDFYDRLFHELVRERSRMIAMLDSTDALFWAVDADFRLLSANEAFQNAQRLTSGRALEVGEPVLNEAIFPAELVEMWRDWYGRALAGERHTQVTDYDTGNGFIYRMAVLSPIRGPGETIVGATVYSFDVTAQVYAERSLQASEARFRSLAASSPAGVFLVDPDGQCMYVNPRLAAIAGMSATELLGTGYTRIMHPDDLPRLAELWRSARFESNGVHAEFRVRTPSGNERYVLTQVAPIFEGGVFTGYVGTVDDITERRAVAQRMRQREKMESLGTLAGGIAHDFNNMLGIVLGYTELALLDIDDPEALRASLDEIRTASIRARELVRQILTFSRRSDRDHAPVDLTALLQESLRLLRPTIPSTVRIEASLPQEALVVTGDATALQQIVMNLCTNAEYAMRGRDDAVLTLRLSIDRRDPGQALITVEDTGEGMSARVRDRLFEPFFTTKPQGEGTGMGLAVVHGIVRAHRGTIAVDSTPGAGSVFRVTIPLATERTQRDELPVVAVQAAEGTVLLVEDEPALARFAAQALERGGYRVVTCGNGEEAYEWCRRAPHEIDLVLSDVAMPRLTGDRLAQRLRALRPELPVILMTGYSQEVSRDDSERLGVHAVLMKPVSAAELLRAVGATLERVRRAGTSSDASSPA